MQPSPETQTEWLHLDYNRTLLFYKEQIKQAQAEGPDVLKAMIRFMAENDLFFLATEVLNRADLYHPFFFERAREIQASPNGHLDLWAREHGKSSLITFTQSISDIIKDPEITIGLFSHTRPIAKAFLRQIMQEMQRNKKLPQLWPEIFWDNPRTQAPKWSEDEGVVVKRKGNPKEATIEAWGLVDGQPTSKHYKCRVYDDVVTKESVSTPEQIQKTTDAWALSSNLGTQDGYERYIGTRYHLFDTYHEMIKRGAVVPRIHPATHNGKEEGEPVLLTRARLDKLRKDQGRFIFAAQMLQNPNESNTEGFSESWIKHAEVSESQAMISLNRYLLCDPANGKRASQRKDPDYTSMWVIGVGPDKNYYLLDGVRDRLNLTARAKHYMRLHRKWQPHGSGYEQYGLQADIEYIELKQAEELYRFSIIELGGQVSKQDRIKWLVPTFEQGKFFLPNTLNYMTEKGEMIDLVKVFIEEEYTAFPICRHDDMLDCMARIKDPALQVIFPDPKQSVEKTDYSFDNTVIGPETGYDWALM